MDSFICNGEKYAYRKETIALPLSLKGLPEQIAIGDLSLMRKSSLHVSLVCVGRLVTKHKIQDPHFEQAVIDDFCDYSAAHDVSFVKFQNDFKLVAQHERRSLIVMCEVSGLDGFFSLINKKYQLKLEPHPTHVTLYTLQPDKGIFLVDDHDLEMLSKPTPNPGLHL